MYDEREVLQYRVRDVVSLRRNRDVWICVAAFLFLLMAMFAGLFGWSYHNWKNEDKNCVSEAEMEAHQANWTKTLKTIGEMYVKNGQNCTGTGGDIQAYTQKQLLALYAFNESSVHFRPSLTTSPNIFRDTLSKAESYFIGPCAKTPVTGDKGFAFAYHTDPTTPTNWNGFSDIKFVDLTYSVNKSFCHNSVAQGQATFTASASQNATTVDKSFNYGRMEDGSVKLTLHHSSLPP